jgi:LmbE family N-acetylglucosaminyl deacetylase
MAAITTIEPSEGRTLLLLVAHADDPALFIGGALAAFAEAGWRIVCCRVTDDRWDSVGLSEAETIARNGTEFREAAGLLGIVEIEELGYATDILGDASEVVLRGHFIRLIRKHRPYAVMSFDPYAMYGEDNQDHVKVAAAADEAFWTSQFPLHHPEHRDEGLLPHGVFERWYFGRKVMEVTDVIDTTAFLDRKIAAALKHETMMRNYVNQLRLQAKTGGWSVPMLNEIAEGAPLGPFIDMIVRGGAKRTGQAHGLAAAEEFRVVRFGGMGGFLERFGQRLQGRGS